MVLLQYRLQPGACIEGMHRQPHHRVAFCGGQAQRIVEAQFRVGAAEPLSVLEVIGPQFDPGPFVAHQRTAFTAQTLQLPQRQRDATDHQLPAPIEAFAQGEAAGPFGKFGLDGQAESAG